MTILQFGHSYAGLPADGPLLRAPRAPGRRRPSSFWTSFDRTSAYYDCFWDTSGERVLLVGPPPANLEATFKAGLYTALPQGKPLKASLFPSRSSMTTSLEGVPSKSSHVEVRLDGVILTLPIQPNAAADFAGANLLVTMNKDNRLDWIAQWADWHARVHGADAVIVFDNGSTRYSASDLEECLAGVAGIGRIAVLEWPYAYGPIDPGVISYPFWSNFLQMASLNVTLRRFAGRANAILNCDVDELVGRTDQSVFDLANGSRDGIVTLKGRWVEPVRADGSGEEGSHLAYRYTSRNPLLSVCATKWALDPSRDWLDDLAVHAGVHRMFGIPRSIGREAPTLPFWHFKAINSNWKTIRTSTRRYTPIRYRRLEALDAAIARYQSAGCIG